MDRNELANGFLTVVSGNAKHPEAVMGPKVFGDEVFVSCYFPRALRVVLRIDESREEYEMEPFGINGFFTVAIPADKKAYNKIPHYTYEAKYEGGGSWFIKDHYAFNPTVDEAAYEAFSRGVNYEIYKLLGAHVTEIDGVKGVRFAVWAPNAINVNIVGNFNNWEGKRFQMIFNDRYGVWELFVPGIGEGQIYKYEIKSSGGLTVLKSDPYAFHAEKRPNNASVVFDIDKYKWNDANYLKKRDVVDY
ncbi:MAG: 1,4-alpha-glucan branching enzyme, partial [Lachnospiraceae bacterium]|nr:1,4-alpha-glucan branching enzyme [Lachnospiraceae bacterium]